MKTITKIACRTIGTLGMGLAIYDASRVAKHCSEAKSDNMKSKQLEKAYFDSRTIDSFSYTSEAIRKNTFEKRSKNPLPIIFGKIKGSTEGFLSSLGNHLITICCSAMAILGKGFFAKVGAAGVGISLLYEVLHNGFGLGKKHPMN